MSGTTRPSLDDLRDRFAAWCQQHHRNGKRASGRQQHLYLLHLDKALTRDEVREIRKAVPPEWSRRGVIPHWKQLYARDLEESLSEAGLERAATQDILAIVK